MVPRISLIPKTNQPIELKEYHPSLSKNFESVVLEQVTKFIAEKPIHH